MKDLQYILKRISKSELARVLKINRSNITNWLAMNRVPKTQINKIKELKLIVKWGQGRREK